jgi:hypothetical protein
MKQYGVIGVGLGKMEIMSHGTENETLSDKHCDLESEWQAIRSAACIAAALNCSQGAVSSRSGHARGILPLSLSYLDIIEPDNDK